MERQDTVKYLSKKCFHGKNVLNPYTGQIMYQPCGECPACLTRKASARSMRLSLQSSISKYTFMIDPTYSQKYVPKYQKQNEQQRQNPQTRNYYEQYQHE